VLGEELAHQTRPAAWESGSPSDCSGSS
jgi:hypothetical protein